jgi:hypothetical protein
MCVCWKNQMGILFYNVLIFSLYKWVCKQAGTLSELPWAGVEPTSVVIGIDCIGSSNPTTIRSRPQCPHNAGDCSIKCIYQKEKIIFVWTRCWYLPPCFEVEELYLVMGLTELSSLESPPSVQESVLVNRKYSVEPGPSLAQYFHVVSIQYYLKYSL